MKYLVKGDEYKLYDLYGMGCIRVTLVFDFD